MLVKRKKTLRQIAFIVFLFFAFATTGLAARIVPTGKVALINDGNVIGEFNQEAPLPEGILLRCEADCVIQLDDVDMAVEPKTAFSVSPMATRNDLMIQQGTVYFTLKEYSRPLHFDTPIENATTGDLFMISDELKGYVRAVEDVTEIGVLSGGAATLKIGSEEIALFPGEKLTIAAADPGKTASATNAQGSLNTNTHITIGAIQGDTGFGAGGPVGGGPGAGGDGGGGPGGGDGGDGPGGGDGGGDGGDGPGGGDGGGGPGGGPGGGDGGDGPGGGDGGGDGGDGPGGGDGGGGPGGGDGGDGPGGGDGGGD
jgi:hypothetical protein